MFERLLAWLIFPKVKAEEKEDLKEYNEHICTHVDMHPYNCFPLACMHCNLEMSEKHDPNNCLFCFMDEEDGLRGVITKNLEAEKVRISL